MVLVAFDCGLVYVILDIFVVVNNLLLKETGKIKNSKILFELIFTPCTVNIYGPLKLQIINHIAKFSSHKETRQRRTYKAKQSRTGNEEKFHINKWKTKLPTMHYTH